MMKRPILHIVHCIDTEGPLDEDIYATFERLEYIFNIKLKPSIENLKAIQQKKIDLSGLEDQVAKAFSPEILNYNRNWSDISKMLNVALSKDFRNKITDDFENGWVYSWHCMDHITCFDNPRHKDFGYGNIFRYYKNKLEETNSTQDEINWHYHPLSLTKNPTHTASSYLNNYSDLLKILCRRIIDDSWFPIVNRPAFHTERPDSHSFLENWIPFDYANQSLTGIQDQFELTNGRFSDWSRASKSWRGYNPSHHDYQTEGNCNRLIFRILNVGTRHRALKTEHFHEAFSEARQYGQAILAFADHDYRNITKDVEKVRDMLTSVKTMYGDVDVKFSGAEEAIINLKHYENFESPEFEILIEGNRLTVKLIKGLIFGPQPFLAIKTKTGDYYHDNLDVIEPFKIWSYYFDEQTLQLETISKVGIGSAGKYGKRSVKVLHL